jgi:hypothetical protein
MKEFGDKMRLIYKPFVLITIGTLLIYTLLYWLLFIKIGIPLKNEVVVCLILFVLSGIPLLIWLRPRMKLLHFKRHTLAHTLRHTRKHTSSSFLIFAWLVILLPMVVVRNYITNEAGKLTQLDNISQITEFEETKYYSLKNYYIDKQHIAVQNTNRITGEDDQNFDMQVYLVMPILKSNTDTLLISEQKYWLGKMCEERISNRLSYQEKEDKCNAFIERCVKEIEKTDFSNITYLTVIGNLLSDYGYYNALQKIKQTSTNEIVFTAEYTPFETRNQDMPSQFFGALGLGQLFFLLGLMSLKFREKELEEFKKGEEEKKNLH